MSFTGTGQHAQFAEIEVSTAQQPTNANGDFAMSAAQEAAALKHVLKLVMLSPEFHVTNVPATPVLNERAPLVEQVSQNRPYKAVVVIYLEGGADSFNMVVPHSGCTNHDLYAEYEATRGTDGDDRRALWKSDLLPIDVSSSAQPCTTFGLHPELGELRQLFEDGDAAGAQPHRTGLD